MKDPNSDSEQKDEKTEEVLTPLPVQCEGLGLTTDVCEGPEDHYGTLLNQNEQ